MVAGKKIGIGAGIALAVLVVLAIVDSNVSNTPMKQASQITTSSITEQPKMDSNPSTNPQPISEQKDSASMICATIHNGGYPMKYENGTEWTWWRTILQESQEQSCSKASEALSFHGNYYNVKNLPSMIDLVRFLNGTELDITHTGTNDHYDEELRIVSERVYANGTEATLQ